MLTVTMTPHLLGFAVTGDYDELNNLYDAVHTLVGDLDDGALSMGEAIARERLLALCYDLRHASMGNRSVRMVDNGMNRDKAEWLGIALPPLKNLNYVVEVLYPEAMYEVMMLGGLIRMRESELTKKGRTVFDGMSDPRIVFDPVCCEVRRYQSLVMEAIHAQTTSATFVRIRNQVVEGEAKVSSMYTQWLDMINIDWCGMTQKKRQSSMSTTVRDISDYATDLSYVKMAKDIDKFVEEQGCPRVNVRLTGIDYPEDYEW